MTVRQEIENTILKAIKDNGTDTAFDILKLCSQAWCDLKSLYLKHVVNDEIFRTEIKYNAYFSRGLCAFLEELEYGELTIYKVSNKISDPLTKIDYLITNVAGIEWFYQGDTGIRQEDGDILKSINTRIELIDLLLNCVNDEDNI